MMAVGHKNSMYKKTEPISSLSILYSQVISTYITMRERINPIARYISILVILIFAKKRYEHSTNQKANSKKYCYWPDNY